MPNPTKPTTNLTREDIRVAIYKFDLSRASSSLAAIAGEMNQDQVDAQYDKDIDRLMQLLDTYTQAKEREARIASVQLYMDTCENNSVDPSWESIHEFQDGQIKALADLEADKENL